MRACPSCKRSWPGDRETCPRCLATLVDDLDATIACPECGRLCPSQMQSCPGCLALLRPAEADLTDDVTRMLSNGLRMHRPAGRAPFAGGPACSVLRLHPQGGLVVCGGDGLIEGNLEGPGIRARPPLVCTTDATTLFRLEVYEAAADAVVAFGADDAPLGTYLRHGLVSPRIDVRDGTSAPVGRLEPAPGSGYRLVETAGRILVTVTTVEVEYDGWIDDQWSLAPSTTDLPMPDLAFVALALAAKVLLGQPEPARARERPEREAGDLDDTLGLIGRSIVDGFFS